MSESAHRFRKIRKWTEEDFRKISRMLADGASYSEIAREFSTSDAIVTRSAIASRVARIRHEPLGGYTKRERKITLPRIAEKDLDT